MKSFLPLVVIILLTSFVVSREKRTVVLIAPEQNILYVGVDNNVILNTKEKVEIKAKGADIEPGRRKGNYIVHVKKPGLAEFTFFDKAGTDLGTSKYYCRQVPKATASVSGKYGGKIEKDALSTLTYLKAEVLNFNYPVRVRVKTFTLTILGGKKTITIPSTGNLINPKMKEALAAAEEGQRIIFEDLILELPGDEEGVGSPILFTVED